MLRKLLLKTGKFYEEPDEEYEDEEEGKEEEPEHKHEVFKSFCAYGFIIIMFYVLLKYGVAFLDKLFSII